MIQFEINISDLWSLLNIVPALDIRPTSNITLSGLLFFQNSIYVLEPKSLDYLRENLYLLSCQW